MNRGTLWFLICLIVTGCSNVHSPNTTAPDESDLFAQAFDRYLASGELDIDALIGFGKQVVLEDARVCELNQQGLRNPVHEHGILMAQEYEIACFHDWLQSRLS